MILACSVQSPVSYRKHTGSSGQPNGSCHKEERLKRRRERASDREGKEGGSGERWWCVGLVKQPCNAMLKIYWFQLQKKMHAHIWRLFMHLIHLLQKENLNWINPKKLNFTQVANYARGTLQSSTYAGTLTQNQINGPWTPQPIGLLFALGQ